MTQLQPGDASPPEERRTVAKFSDPVRLEVIKNALESIADGMAITVVRTSRSSVVRNGLDFSTAMLNPKGELVGQGVCQAIHLGGMEPALKSCLDRYQDRIYPGDILLSNDPYEGGSHLPDIFQYKPIFVGDTLAAYACAMTHHTDIGGRVAGGNSCDSTEIYQEGLRIPPLKLYERGVPNETLFRVLEKAVRVPEKVLGDVLGQVAALHFGEREFLRLVEQYGVEELLSYQEELLDYTELLTRNVIRTMPDGTWSFTDYIDDDGFDPEPITIVATITKKDDELHVDFTGTSPQCKGAIQPVFPTTKGMVYSAVRCVISALGAVIPNASGYFRPVKVTAPDGTFVNPLPPAPVAARNLGCIRTHQTVLGAFAQMLPDIVYACSGGCEALWTMAGYDKTRAPWKAWVQIDSINELSSGGYPWRDGIDAESSGSTNIANIPAEVMEVDHPVQIREYAILTDSEGAGKYRGGMGIVREFCYLLDDTTLQVRSDRVKHSPFGIAGGGSPPPNRVIIKSGNDERSMPSKFIAVVKNGDVLRSEMPGGGGWGDPLERDPQSVLDDVVAERVSVKRARQVYGVVIDAQARQVDLEATQKQRGRLRQQR